MKTFLEFIDKPKPKFIGWHGQSFGELRDNKPNNKPKFLGWHGQSFGERRNVSLKEEFAHDEHHSKIESDVQDIINHGYEPHMKFANEYGGKYHSTHVDPFIYSQKLTKDQQQYIHGYTNIESNHPDDDPIIPHQGRFSSKNLNYFLRNKAGAAFDKTRGFISEVPGSNFIRTEAHMEDAVEKLTSCFTKENLNKTRLITYGGVPPVVGQELEALGEGGIIPLAGFTSTSTFIIVALRFAMEYGIKNVTMISYNIPPFTGLSVAKYSGFNENEILLRYGTKIKYKGTTNHVSEVDMMRVRYTTYHVDVLPLSDAMSLSDYGQYDHPITPTTDH